MTVSSWSCPIAACPLLVSTPIDLERLVLDADDLAGRIGADAEQLVAHDRAEHRDLARARVTSSSVKKLPNCVGHDRIARELRRRPPAPACSSCRSTATICVRVLSPGEM